MLIKVNGEDKQIQGELDVNALIAQHGLTPQNVAVELNRRLLKREKYDTALKDGDRVEIVTFVGGG